MRDLLIQWRRFALCARGAAAAEYAVTLALIVMVAASSIALLNSSCRSLWLGNQAQLSQSLSSSGRPAANGGREAGSLAHIDDELSGVSLGKR